jgi:hypothetical protein
MRLGDESRHDVSEERAARYSDLFAGRRDHSAECAYCPICATIAVVRNTRPEVVEHLAAAAREMIAAAGILLEEAEQVIGRPERQGRPPGAEAGTPRHEETVRRIDIG